MGNDLKKILSALGLLLLACIAGVFLFANDIDVHLTEAQVQEAIDRKIAEGPVEHFGITLTPEKAKIDFDANNQAWLDLELSMHGFDNAGRFKGRMGTGINYQEPKIYLADMDYSGLELELSPASDRKFSDIENVARDFLQRQKNDALTEEARESYERVFAANEERIREIAGELIYNFFASIPVYDLTDHGAGGTIAALALKEVRFSETEAIVTLSPRQALIKILLMIFSAIFFLAYVIFYMFGTAPFESLLSKGKANRSDDTDN